MMYTKKILIIPTAFFLIAGMLGNITEVRSEISSYTELEKIIIQDKGRYKPLDTYARSTLLQFNSRSSFNGQQAIAWLARVLFSPQETLHDKIFRINSPQVVQALGIKEEKRFRYSFHQLHPARAQLHQLASKAFKIEENKRTSVERELIGIYHNLNFYIGLLSSMQFMIPHSDFTIRDSSFSKYLNVRHAMSSLSYMDMIVTLPQISRIVDSIQTISKSDLKDFDVELFRISERLFSWTREYQHYPIDIIPPPLQNEEKWLNPWNALALYGWNTRSMYSEIEHIRKAAIAYQDGDDKVFNRELGKLNESIAARIDKKQGKKNSYELFYNSLDPFYKAELFYGSALLLWLMSFLFFRTFLFRTSSILVAAGFLIHLAGMLVRHLITDRPPITNLYETFIFVAAISVVLGMLIELFTRKTLGVLIASFSGLMLLLISGKFSSDGDTLRVLVAVLDSNFWLSTHVIAINLGYAGCCVTGVIGHVYIIQALLKDTDPKKLDATYKMIFGTLGFGIIFTFIGTVLGGIWADQSWGRFWGWDPKENGALLIVIWCAILFHARMGKLIGKLGFAIGSVLGIIVVMMSWFGINLLGVGLHSYGFTSGVLKSLIVYIVIELLFISLSLLIIKKRQQSSVDYI